MQPVSPTALTSIIWVAAILGVAAMAALAIATRRQLIKPHWLEIIGSILVVAMFSSMALLGMITTILLSLYGVMALASCVQVVLIYREYLRRSASNRVNQSFASQWLTLGATILVIANFSLMLCCS